MSSHGNHRATDETPFLQIDSATFQAVVTATVTAIMAHLNANNTSENGNGVENSNRNNNQGNQKVPTYKNIQTYKPENMKRKKKIKRSINIMIT